LANKRIPTLLLLAYFLCGCSHFEQRESNVKIEATEARTKLGLAYLKQGDKTKALKNLLIALRYSPHDLTVNMSLAHYYTLVDNYSQANSYYHAIMQQYPNTPEVLNNYGVFLCHYGKFSQASIIFKKVFSLPVTPQIVTSYFNSGLCAQKNHNVAEAKNMFNMVLVYQPENLMAYQHLVDIALNEGKSRQAYKLLQRYSMINKKRLPNKYAIDYEQLKTRYN
jgi:type IV pilus assembly protein PilF